MENQNNPAKYAFFYMLSLVALTFMAISSGMIIFQIINKLVPDILNAFSGRFSPDTLKAAMSSLIISAPVYFMTMRQIRKSLSNGELNRDSSIRKWLTYFILFVSSVVMLIWMIFVINNFLDGELTSKFILKAITAIGIAAAIFSFYYYDIRKDQAGGQGKVIRTFAYSAIVFVAAVFVSSLFVVESPSQTRNRKIDNNILDEFSQIDGAINTFYRSEGRLPQDLEELKVEVKYILDDNLASPSGEKYEYKAVGEKEYELCAEFMTSNLENDTDLYEYYVKEWPHNSGYQCISNRVDEAPEKPVY